jgi:hypothetical protein
LPHYVVGYIIDPDSKEQDAYATGQAGDSAQEIRHREDLVRWVRDQMAQYTTLARPMQSEDAFLGGMTVEAYLALPEAERERIWDELYAAAIETSQEHEVKPDAVVPAR